MRWYMLNRSNNIRKKYVYCIHLYKCSNQLPLNTAISTNYHTSIRCQNSSNHGVVSQYTALLSDTDRQLADGIISGDRYALSRGITLVESRKAEDRYRCNQLLTYIIQHNKPTHKKKHNRKITYKIGITGTPGVGKSTFIEALGKYLVHELQLRVSVLSIDPSSRRTGGSILGDKTRMIELSRMENAYIRPSPSACALGGVAAGTADALTLVESAGYDVCIVETVGVGQSEVSVTDMVDMFILLVAPGGGDELQGLKKGIVEVADLIVVNKADGDLLNTARHTKTDYMHAVQLLPTTNESWQPQVVLCSCISSADTPYSVQNVWRCVDEFYQHMATDTNRLEQKRAQQRVRLLYDYMYAIVTQDIKKDTHMRQLVREIESSLRTENMVPRVAAQLLLQQYTKYKQTHNEQISNSIQV